MFNLDFEIPPKTPEDISDYNNFILLMCLVMLGADERHSNGEISDEEYNDFIKKCQNVMDDIIDTLPKNNIQHPPILPPSLCPGCCGG